ncbi:MAG: pyrroloquinoline quinone biosynthesis protein PqqB [Planctomycetaceae bacterium]|nr:pyrroloquinoline quinone biosynthesis protein PqqB [Planctomycetaceae bacterium]
MPLPLLTKLTTFLVFLTYAGNSTDPFIVVLGIAQDGGYPHAGCKKECCTDLFESRKTGAMVSCLAIIDPETKQRWILDCTPDFPQQLAILEKLYPRPKGHPLIDGIFLTHAHIGHYSGLIHLGREVIGAKSIPVHVMPRMKGFLQTNGPWDQLVRLSNITLKDLQAGRIIKLNDRIKIEAITVPHRDEYSETVGFRVIGPRKSILFIPDIDKWEKWDLQIETLIGEVERSYLDGTFFSSSELPNRSIEEIPHPLIQQSIQRFIKLPDRVRNSIHFIHLNHTNPALRKTTPENRLIRRAGMQIAKELDIFNL